MKPVSFWDRLLSLGIEWDSKRPMLSARTFLLHITELVPAIRRSASHKKMAARIESDWQIARLKDGRPL